MKKNTKIVVSAAFDARLGMPIMRLKDQDGEIHSFHFLPSNFIQFAESLANVGNQAIPADLYIAESIQNPSNLDKKTIEKVVKSARSQSEGFAVMAIPSHDLALLALRSSSGEEANIQLSKADIDKLINHLLNAKEIIDTPGRDIH